MTSQTPPQDTYSPLNNFFFHTYELITLQIYNIFLSTFFNKFVRSGLPVFLTLSSLKKLFWLFLAFQFLPQGETVTFQHFELLIDSRRGVEGDYFLGLNSFIFCYKTVLMHKLSPLPHFAFVYSKYMPSSRWFFKKLQKN